MGKNPWFAALLSFLIAGLGQLYVGRMERAVFFFLLEIATAAYHLKINATVGLALNMLVSLWSATDAFRLAKKYKPKQDSKEQREIYV